MEVKFEIFVILSLFLSFFGVCGKISDDTLNERSPIKFQVSVQCENMHICSGTILNSKYVLTAAHCVADFISGIPYPKYYIKIRSGELDISVETIIVHGQYKYYKNDIAIVKLRQKLLLSALVQPVKLFTGTVPAGTKIAVYGWEQERKEKETELRFSILTTLSEDDCRIKLIDISAGVLCLVPENPEIHSHLQSGRSAIYKGKLVGLGNFLATETDIVAGFANISYYANWIRDHIDT